jgi:hypothetical protein
MSTHNGKMMRKLENWFSNINPLISWRKENKLSLHYEDQPSMLFRNIFAVCSDFDVNTTTRKTKKQMGRWHKKWHEETESKELD